MANKIEQSEIAYNPEWPLQFQPQTLAGPTEVAARFDAHGSIWSAACFCSGWFSRINAAGDIPENVIAPHGELGGVKTSPRSSPTEREI
jgi:hypothetical protein